MIWSDSCINPTAGFDIQENGTMKPKKLGYWVMTIEECQEYLNKRK